MRTHDIGFPRIPISMELFPCAHFCTLPRNYSRTATFWAGKVTRRGNKVASSQYIVRQIATLLKFAKTTSDPGIAAALVEKATNLKDRIDETLPAPDVGSRAPDVEPTA
jgi:hypothetical protein